jgi:hypothetical protein
MEIEEEDEIEGIEEEEEEFEPEIQKPAVHVPTQLKTVPEGGVRAVSRTILTGQVMPPNKLGWRKNPKMRGRTKFRRLNAVHEKMVKRSNAPKDGVYRGQISGISQTKKGSIRLGPAH